MTLDGRFPPQLYHCAWLCHWAAQMIGDTLRNSAFQHHFRVRWRLQRSSRIPIIFVVITVPNGTLKRKKYLVPFFTKYFRIYKSSTFSFFLFYMSRNFLITSQQFEPAVYRPLGFHNLVDI